MQSVNTLYRPRGTQRKGALRDTFRFLYKKAKRLNDRTDKFFIKAMFLFVAALFSHEFVLRIIYSANDERFREAAYVGDEVESYVVNFLMLQDKMPALYFSLIFLLLYALFLIALSVSERKNKK